jgi:hypothetical protein
MKNWTALIRVVFFAMFLCGATGAGVGAQGKDASITLERGGCLGKCPVYSVEVHGDGTVQYNGKMFVHDEGAHTAKISQAAVHELFQKFEDAKFFDLGEADPTVNDVPTLTLAVSIEGRRKVVKDGCVCRPEVEALALDVDQASGSKRWVRGWFKAMFHGA